MTTKILETTSSLTVMAREVYEKLMDVDIKDDETRLEKAAHRIEAKILKNRKLPADIVEAVRIAARYLARIAQHSVRSEAYSGRKIYIRGQSDNNPRVYTDGEIETVRKGTMFTLYDTVLRDGTKLGDATGIMLRENAGHYLGQGRGMMEKGLFYQAIAEEIGEESIVREKLSLEDLEGKKKAAHNKACRIGR